VPWTKILADAATGPEVQHAGGRVLSLSGAIQEATAQLLEADDRVIVLGQGVDDPGGVFGTTDGLVDRFGAERVIDIPIAENGLTGVAIGAAVAGLRPIFVHMRMDFLPMCMDQLVNHAAKWHFMTGGQVSVPLVIRCIVGRGWGSAAQHSQALHGMFLNVPGLKIVMPAFAADAKGLLLSAVDDGNPVLFVEHRWTFSAREVVPEEPRRLPLGVGVVRRAGQDVTVVAFSLMVHEALRAAEQLEAEGVSLEVIDPRGLRPLDLDLILSSVRKTGRLVVADIGVGAGGAAAEIAYLVGERAFPHLKAPPRRVALPEAPAPASAALEQAYYPGAADIAGAARALLESRG